MLVISRRKDESVYLGNSIVVQVLSIQGGRVQLGISAAADVRILRAELAGRDRKRRIATYAEKLVI